MADMDLVEIAILTLLLGGIGYGVVLSRRLDRLGRALAEFGPALAAFSAAVDRSERSVQDLRTESARIGTVAANANRPASAPAAGRAPVAAPAPEPADDREVLIASLMEIVRGRRRGC